MKTQIAAVIQARELSRETGVIHRAYELAALAPCEERYVAAIEGVYPDLTVVDDSAWSRYCERTYLSRAIHNVRLRRAA